MKVRQQGFSLIELIIVVMIIGILGSLAYPSYQEYVRETKKTDGITMINKVMQAQEKFFVNRLTYTLDLEDDLGFSANTDLPSDEGYYLLTAEACGDGIAECVNITAVAQGSQITGDPDEDDLDLNSKGIKAGKWPNDH